MRELLPVTFHGDTLYVANHQNQPYVPMRPIVESMGLDWGSQSTKLNSNKARWGVVIITTPSKSGGRQKHLCLPLRKLPGWLMTLHPNRVAAGKREKVVRYQNECDDVLWEHWGHNNPPPALPAPSTPNPFLDQRRYITVVEAGRVTHMLELEGDQVLLHRNKVETVRRNLWTLSEQLLALIGEASADKLDLPVAEFEEAPE